MARIYPFRAWRYNPSAVRLDDVVTQPYDKISPAMQQAYYERSPYNLVRIIPANRSCLTPNRARMSIRARLATFRPGGSKAF